MRITYLDGESWIGIGVNMRDDGRQMAPSYSVIGDIDRGVQRYFLGSNARDGSGVFPLEDIHGHLKSASFVQEEGVSSLEFTHDLVTRHEETGEFVFEADGDSTWIWAVGLPDNEWAGKHRIHGSFNELPLFEGCTIATEAPTAGLTSTNFPTAGSSSTETDPEDSDEPQETDTTATAKPTSSVGASAGQISLSKKNSELSRGLWLSHGILMGIAWGIFAPLAIGAAFLRKMKALQKDALWLTLHFYLNLSTIIFTVFGFIFAVVATQKDGSTSHFQKDTHHMAGLAVFVLVIVQGIVGMFHPEKPSDVTEKVDDSTKPETPNNRSFETESFSVKNGLVLDDAFDVDAEGMEVIDRGHKETHDEVEIEEYESVYSYNSSPSPPPTKNAVDDRLHKYFHRFLGITLLGLAWYNCTSGIALQAENYPQDDQQRLM
ncbi:MAG: hypothetical protein SGARI_000624, partial [Bacillariaceae sp.]